MVSGTPPSLSGLLESRSSSTTIPLPLILTRTIRSFWDKTTQGWLAWSDELELYRQPHPTRSTFLPWEKPSEAAVASARDVVTESTFWKKLSTHFAEENNEVVVSQDNMSCVKSICKLVLLDFLDSDRPQSNFSRISQSKP